MNNVRQNNHPLGAIAVLSLGDEKMVDKRNEHPRRPSAHCATEEVNAVDKVR